MKFYTKETNEIIQNYFPGSEELKNQKIGSAADYILPTGEVIEVKLDFMASKTGNLFIEFQYTNPEGTRPSGIKLAADRGYSVVIVILDYSRNIKKVLKMSGKDLISLCESSTLRTVDTGRGANGNRDGVSSKGYLLPLIKCPIEWIQTKGTHE